MRIACVASLLAIIDMGSPLWRLANPQVYAIFTPHAKASIVNDASGAATD